MSDKDTTEVTLVDPTADDSCCCDKEVAMTDEAAGAKCEEEGCDDWCVKGTRFCKELVWRGGYRAGVGR
ncbi:hypothetical protein NPX13_g3681 [Xylaria arbuscula]|uniref:Uncharacterized protein n=1 Tax=Xylaria arbuscula TaxID=114810 RepID=A0A9W8NHT1_9PEZI|nr:hypothetical protein NPX13_g3681 [Xylaria arbuscula]